MERPIEEDLYMNQPLGAKDAIAQLSIALGMSDSEVISQIPELENFTGFVSFTMASGNLNTKITGQGSGKSPILFEYYVSNTGEIIKR